MVIAWYGPTQPTPRQVVALETTWPKCSVNYRGPTGNAARTVADFRQSGAADVVVIAPLAVLHHLLREGLSPIWSEAVECEPNHPEREWEVKGRHFRFVEFKRLVSLSLRTEEPRPLVPGAAIILRWTRHPMSTEEESALRALYSAGMNIVTEQSEVRHPNDVVAQLRRLGAHDLVLVAPLSVFDGLCRQGTNPLKAIIAGSRFERFIRVIGLELRFEPVRGDSVERGGPNGSR